VQIIKALRPPQMLKNLLIFAPIITLGNYQTSEFYLYFIKYFFGFSCVVFSTYILNDLIDIESDKLHPIKKFRPVASGVMPLSNWTIISSILFLIGILWLYIIDLTALVIALIYCSVSISYSLKLKIF
jgi:4-hydroxybenzoate polyprenyltransferase